MTFEEVKKYLMDNRHSIRTIYQEGGTDVVNFLIGFIDYRLNSREDVPMSENERTSIVNIFHSTIKALLYKRLTEQDRKDISVIIKVLKNVANMYPEDFELFADICLNLDRSERAMEETILVLKLLLKESSCILERCREPGIDMLARIYYDSYDSALKENKEYEV